MTCGNQQYLTPPPGEPVLYAVLSLRPGTLDLRPSPGRCLQTCTSAGGCKERLDNKMNIGKKKRVKIKCWFVFPSPTPSTRSNSAFVGLIIASTFIVPILLISLSVNESWKNSKHHQFGAGQVGHILNAKYDTVWQEVASDVTNSAHAACHV